MDRIAGAYELKGTERDIGARAGCPDREVRRGAIVDEGRRSRGEDAGAPVVELIPFVGGG